jgi:DNA polymerase I
MVEHEYFLIVDGHALIYRAYHAFPGLTNKHGQLVNAVYGFARILLTAIRDFRPLYVTVAFDHPLPTFRHQAFENYKAHRPEMPDDLKSQIAIVKQVVTALNIPQFEVPGYEADDLIGTVARQAAELVINRRQPHLMTLIVTGDRDAFQLVNEYVHVWMPARGKGQLDTEYDAEGVKTKMGVTPEQIIDLKALMGDASDNIPGVRGIGEKTAVKLIQELGSLEGVYQALANNKATGVIKPKAQEMLMTDKDSAYLSKDLATINTQAPITLELEKCRVTGYDKQTAISLFEELDFKSLISLLPIDEFEMGIQDALF